MTEKHTAKDHFQDAMGEFVAHNYGNSIEHLNHAIESDPEFKIAYMSRGSAHLKMDQLDEALEDFNRVIELDSNYPKAYHLRALVHEKSGDNESALSDLDRAIELDPEYGAAYYSRATLHAKMGQTDLAAEDIESVTHLTNANIETFANENNVWRSNQFRLEDAGAADPMLR